MAKPIDLELKKAFNELQTKMLETRKQIQVMDSQIGVFKRVLQHIDITQSEIGVLPPDSRTYESVGRMFILTDLGEVKSNLSKRKRQMIARLSDVEHKKSYMDYNLKESEDNLREMVQLRKEQIKA